MHPALAAIRDATKESPYQGRLWLVGGAVRDELLGIAHTADFDLVLEGDALDVAQYLQESRVAESLPVEYGRFGVAMVRVQGATVEIVTARKESYDPSSRKPHIQPASLQEDALRRDFTVNALLRNLHDGNIADPLGAGLADLQAKVLRTPLDPDATFTDDPLRMLRAVRFRWRLGFSYAEGLTDAIRRCAPRLKIVSVERIREEWLKMLTHPTAAEANEDLMNLELLQQFLPEIETMKGLFSGKWEKYDVWRHTLKVLWNLSPTHPELALAALLHDIGKPPTLTRTDAGFHFHGHEQVGEEITRKILNRLRFSNDEIDRICILVRNHMRLGSFAELSDSGARRLIRDMGEALPDLLDLIDADRRGYEVDEPSKHLGQIRAKLREIESATPAESLRSPLSGEEIISLVGKPPGPEIGRIKRRLEEMVIEGSLQVGDKDSAVKAVLAMEKP